MKRLKISLKSKYFILILIIVALLRVLSLKLCKSIYSKDDSSFICTVESINSNSKVLLNCNELLESKIEDRNIKIGDILSINGFLEEFNSNSNINLFNYKEYQNNKGIIYKLNIVSYKKIGVSNNIILGIKRFIINRIENLKSSNYLKSFILGDKSGIDSNLISKLGLIHLFCVSGMHITFLIALIENNIRNKLKNAIVTITLLFYYLLINNLSIFRCLIFTVVKKLNKYLNLNLNIYYELLISISLILILKPFAIYDTGFYYSVIISSGISLFNTKVKINNKIIKKIMLSTFIFLLSFPLLTYTSFEVNITSIIFNIIFIPFVSIIMFPLSLLTFIFPLLDNILIVVISLFNLMIEVCEIISIRFIFMKPSVTMILFYYFIIYLILYNYKLIYFLIIIIIFHYNYNSIFESQYVLFLNVYQGDAVLIHDGNSNILIDTGGIRNYNLLDNSILPVLKSLGIRKITVMITSHGDYDHMGEAVNLVNNFKVEKVVFNCGEYNDLEKELIKVLDKKKIKYYSCIKELNVDNSKLYFLQTGEYDNENDNSNVIYTEIDGYKFMFMGDAEIEKEKDILNKYNINDIDVLKVGHHGSKTSSSDTFINEMKPKYSVISVGKNNRYGHPNKEVLNNLEDSKIYRTDEDGSIMFKIKNYKMKIEMSEP